MLLQLQKNKRGRYRKDFNMCKMKRKSLFVIFFCLMTILSYVEVLAQVELPITDKRYHEQISWLWNQKKDQYAEMIKKSGTNPTILYDIQTETNNLLKYAGYYQKYSLVDELISLYLNALDTLTITDQYLYAYYPGSPRLSVHQLDKKYRMWVDNQKPIGQEIILESSQFLYLLSDTVSIITDVRKDKRSPIMKEALNKFIPLLVEHYNRWIFNTPGPFQVHGWGCSYDDQNVPTAMNHQEFLVKKLERKLGNGKSPSYCNVVQDIDMWIITGVANLLTVNKKEKGLVNISSEEYRKMSSYVKTGIKLLESRFSYTELKDFNGKTVVGALFDKGIFDDHPEFEFAGYSGKEFPMLPLMDKAKYRGRNVGWDLSHARRFVHIFDSLMKSKNVLGLDFPTRALVEKMVNQFIYGTFNRDFKKPLFANFMDGTNGWFRVNYSGKSGFAYGPWDMSESVLTGGYGFWSRYNPDIQKVFVAIMNMLESNDPDIRNHVIEHYETNFWNHHKRASQKNLKNMEDAITQSVFIQMLPSLCFMLKRTNAP